MQNYKLDFGVANRLVDLFVYGVVLICDVILNLFLLFICLSVSALWAMAEKIEGDPKAKLGYPSSFYYFSVQIAV